MSSRRILLVALAGLGAGGALSLGGCVAAADAPNVEAGGNGGTAGASTGVTLAFDSDEPLSLQRGDVATLTVQATPPGRYSIRFALLPGPEMTPPGDAALNVTEQETTDDGLGTVDVTAPSAPTTFYVRASSAGAVSDQRLVTVNKTGLADLLVVPTYAGGRIVETWLAATTPNQTCATLPGGPLDDSLIWTSSTAMSVDLRGVKADTQLAVVIRAERYAWGCATIEAAVEGVANRVQVPVTNVPIQLTESNVSLSLDLTDFEDMFAGALAPVATALLDSMAADVDDDVSLLLDAMQTHSDSNGVAFGAVRTAERWDAVVADRLGPNSARALRDPLERWFAEGPRKAAGPLRATLSAFGTDPTGARLVLTGVADKQPAALGFADESDAVWYSPQGDQVVLGAALAFSTSAFVVGSAESPALLEVSGVDDIGEALATLLSCETLASVLVEYGQVPTESYAGCNLECTRDLCQTGVEAILAALSERSADAPATIEIAATGEGTVGSAAELVGLDGSWVGSLTVDSDRVELGGKVIAPAPAP